VVPRALTHRQILSCICLIFYFFCVFVRFISTSQYFLHSVLQQLRKFVFVFALGAPAFSSYSVRLLTMAAPCSR